MPDVLVIDDDTVEHVLLARIIKRVDPTVEVRAFHLAEDALKYLASPDHETPRLIFVDINMPRMNGFEFASSFEAAEPAGASSTQVWMMSNSNDPRDRSRAMSEPSVSGFIDKSSPDEAFARIVEAALSGDAA